MKNRIFLAGVAALALGSPAWAQFGSLFKQISSAVNNGAAPSASSAANPDAIAAAGQMLHGMAGIGPDEEKVIGDSVALEIVGRYGGLVRDDAMLLRVNLVGRSLARFSDRPDLNWRFAVLNSDTVNAFSAPDGYVFITKGLFALVPGDGELAGVLGHEISHITGRHALKIVSRGNFISGAAGLAAATNGNVRNAQAQLQQFDLGIGQIANTLFEKGFDPQTEYEADHNGRALAFTTGFAPGGLRAVLVLLQGRGGDPKVVFSTHPPLKQRIKRLPSEVTAQ